MATIIASVALFISISIGTYVFFRKPPEEKKVEVEVLRLMSSETQTEEGLWLANLPMELEFDPPSQVDIDKAITCYTEYCS